MKVSNVFAAWLIVLILLPFTAPFSTYEVPNHFTHGGRESPFVPHTDTALGCDTAAAVVPARLADRTGKPAAHARSHHKSTRLLRARRVTCPADSVATAADLQALGTVLRL